MISRAPLFAGLAAAMCISASATAAEPDYQEIFGEIEFEGTGFAETPAFDRQRSQGAAIAGKATLLLEWAEGDYAFRFTPFGRVDATDDRRTHFDIRELKLDGLAGDWSFTVGVDTVFWGKTEAVHLVDVVNQTDQVEGLDGEDKLGQPMLRFGYLAEIGEFSGYLLPYFRERTFAGARGRLRGDPPVKTGGAIYGTAAEEWTPAAAARFAGVFGDVDLGLSGFYGLGRDPAFFFDGQALRPFYELIGQVGVDAQLTDGATLWKGEAIARFDQKNARFRDEDFVALTGGLEHTLFGVMGSNADLGLIVEYALDSRFSDASTPFRNDLILGARLALNDALDTEILLTGALDAQSAETTFRLEASRRLNEDFSVSLEGQAFANTDSDSPLHALRRDSFMRVKLTYYFGG